MVVDERSVDHIRQVLFQNTEAPLAGLLTTFDQWAPSWQRAWGDGDAVQSAVQEVCSVMGGGRHKTRVVRGRWLPLPYFAAVRLEKGHFPIMGSGL
jgi:hypothetical protein